MASREEYTVGWVCALAVEVEAAKATLDRIHTVLPADPTKNDTNTYTLGSLNGHNVVVASPTSGKYGATSIADIVTQLRANFKSLRFSLLVGIGGGVPSTKEDIRLGDIVVGKSASDWPAFIQQHLGGGIVEDQFINAKTLGQPSPLLLKAVGKTETAHIFGESQLSLYVSEIVKKDTSTFAHPGSEQDILFSSDYDHTTIKPAQDSCDCCNPDEICNRPPRDDQKPRVHYGPIASSSRLMCHGTTRDKLAHEHGILCFETEAAGLTAASQCLIIRGICDYADSHNSKLWHAYAAAVAAAYAKELLSFIPTIPKLMSGIANPYLVAAPILDALLLTRPEVDRRSLIALKGRRVGGTCEWLLQHSSYQKWLVDADAPLLWISGGPGKGKSMLAIYLTEELQPVVDSTEGILLYYFCSNRDKNRNTALTIMRGILHQWLNLQPNLAQYIKNSFEGTETTKYTISSFVSLWRIFLTLLQQSGSSQVVCVLDGLDECEKESLRQFLDAVENYLPEPWENSKSRLKLILLSRPQPTILETKLCGYQRIKLDESDTEISNDVERYISAKVAELASEQNLSEEMILHVRQTLLAGADGTFLWVGFVANELKGRSWSKLNNILRSVPKGLGGIYRRLLQQVEDKEQLVSILQWIVLAARPLTVNELTAAAGIEATDGLQATEVMKRRLLSCGLMVKVEGDVVNLVHESAKEFFQSDQVNTGEIKMFYMNQNTHRILLRTCLTHIEGHYGRPSSKSDKPLRHALVAYASLYWPMHFQQAINVIDITSEFSRPFFQAESSIREGWWKFFWEQENIGGIPPSFTLLHLAAYLGNLKWANILLAEHARLISRKDNYGRTPLSWAVNRGHRDMTKLLLDHGAHVNAKDRSDLTALHIAVSGQHTEIVSLLLDHHARLESKAKDDGDTPLILAIQVNSKDIIKLLLEHGACLDQLPLPPGGTSLKGSQEPLDERAIELLGLQQQLFNARYENASRRVDMVMKAGSLSFRFPLVLSLVTLYLKFMAVGRWNSLSVLQQLVKENKAEELRRWAQTYRKFYVQLAAARDPKRLVAMTELPTTILRSVSADDLKALLVIMVMVGSECKLATIRFGWREGDTITARAFARWAQIACSREAEEFLHYGIREFLADFDGSIQKGNREENVARATLLLTCHIGMLENREPRPIEYFATVIAEFYAGYIGGSHEDELFSDANQSCANELSAISEDHDSSRLLLFVTSIFRCAQRSREKGQDRFLDMPSAACLLLCQNNASDHQWLIGEALPETLSVLISQQQQGSLQKRACKTLVECLIIGKQHGFVLPITLRQRVQQHLHTLTGVDVMLHQIVDL